MTRTRRGVIAAERVDNRYFSATPSDLPVLNEQREMSVKRAVHLARGAQQRAFQAVLADINDDAVSLHRRNVGLRYSLAPYGTLHFSDEFGVLIHPAPSRTRQG